MIRGTVLFPWPAFHCLSVPFPWFIVKLITKAGSNYESGKHVKVEIFVSTTLVSLSSEILALTWVWRSRARRRPSSRRPAGRYEGGWEPHTSLPPAPARRSGSRQWTRVRRPASERFRNHLASPVTSRECSDLSAVRPWTDREPDSRLGELRFLRRWLRWRLCNGM